MKPLKVSIFDRIHGVHVILRSNPDKSVGGFVATATAGLTRATRWGYTRRVATANARASLAREIRVSA